MNQSRGPSPALGGNLMLLKDGVDILVTRFARELFDCLERQERAPKAAFWIDVGNGQSIMQVCSSSMSDEMGGKESSGLNKPGFFLNVTLPNPQELKRFSAHPQRHRFSDLLLESVPGFACFVQDDVADTIQLTLRLLRDVYVVPLDETVEINSQSSEG